MHDEVYDAVIIGAGCAGLSLACELINQVPEKRFAVVEPRTSFERDRTWCFWQSLPQSFDVPVRHRWSKFLVGRGSKKSIFKARDFSYSCTFADDYYAAKLSKLNASQSGTLMLGESAISTRFSDKVVVETDKRILKSELLFDSKPPRFRSGGLLQDFYGMHVRLDRDVFDSDCITLMDFHLDSLVGDGFHFFYVLPFSRKEALVESVCIGPSRLSPEKHDHLIRQYLTEVYAVHRFETLYTEVNCLPMHAVQVVAEDSRCVNIGTRGGLMRTSTGYAFAAIQRCAVEIAQSLKVGNHPHHRSSPSPRASLLDDILLEHLARRPSDGPLLLSSLFFYADSDVVIRFLCDRANLLDMSTIVAAMPRKFELSQIMVNRMHTRDRYDAVNDGGCQIWS